MAEPNEEVVAGAAAAINARAGRNLGAATLVGLGLLAVISLSLIFRVEVFVLLIGGAAVAGVWELARAFANKGIHVPQPPLYVGAVGMVASAWVGGPGALLIALILTVATVLVWRVLDGGGADATRDITVGAFVAVYVPFMLSFLVLTVRISEFGVILVATIIVLVAANDTGGYAAGIWLGKHKLAPHISPGKTWEGVIGSISLTTLVSLVMMVVVIGAPWWAALLLGVIAVAAATLGDLAESLLKRDLGVKDFGSILPGHGGVLDRIDSTLFAAPAGYAIFTLALI